MITKFKIFETLKNNTNIPEDILNNIINTLSFITYKGNKRNDQKHKNYKSIRLLSIDGYYNKNIINSQNKTIDNFFEIEMNNKDIIKAKYTKCLNLDEIIENTIYIEINDIPIYHMENENYNINTFIELIGIQYKKYLDKKWKIK